MHSRHHVPCLTALALFAAVLTLPAAAGAQSEGISCSQAATASPFGASTGNFAHGPALLASTAPIIGTTPALQLTHANPFPVNGALLISLGATTTLFDCLSFYVDFGPTLGVLPVFVPPGGGVLPISIPFDPAQCTGIPVYFQIIVQTFPAGSEVACLPLQATNGLQWVIGHP